MYQPQRQLVGQAISTTRQLRPLNDQPKSIGGRWKYFPAKYECIRLVPTMTCKWYIVEVYQELFYFDLDSSQRAGLGIASNTGLPFIAGLKHFKIASKSDLSLLNLKED